MKFHANTAAEKIYRLWWLHQAGQFFTTRPCSLFFFPLPFRFLAPELRKCAVIFLNPPFYPSRVAGVSAGTRYRLLPKIERESAHRVYIPPEGVQIAENFPSLVVSLGQRCGLLAC